MEISVTEAKAQLTDLVRRAEAGEEVVLTRHGQPAARLVPVSPRVDRTARHALLESLIGVAARDGDDAARSQDWLYDEAGLPR